MSCWMRCTTGLVIVLFSCSNSSAGRCSGLQRQGMKLVAHAAPESLIDHLVLLDPRLADEGRGNHGRRVMVAIAAQILDIHPSIGDRLLDQPLDLARVHRHQPTLTLNLRAHQPGQEALMSRSKSRQRYRI